ncbi:MAG: toxic anion resistance protein, partial [Clostridia bacterium]
MTAQDQNLQAPTPHLSDMEPVRSPEDLTLTQLPAQDQAAVKAYAEKINVCDTTEVLQYGAQAQEKLSVFADTALSNVRTKDTGVIGETLTDLVTQLEGFGASKETSKGIFGIFRRASNQVASLKARYDKVEVNVEKVAGTLSDHRVQLLRDIALLDRLYDENVEYYRQLCFYIVAGREKITALRTVDLPTSKQHAQTTNDPADAQIASDLGNAIDRFEKKIFDLELTRQISIQMAPQIRLIQNNDSLMADKIHSTLVNTLPLWKSQMVLALGLENSRAALEAQRQVTDATNRMLRENAAALKTGT